MTADVRPTSLWAGSVASFSRTRYPASEPVATLHAPATPAASIPGFGAAPCAEGGCWLRVSSAGASSPKTAK